MPICTCNISVNMVELYDYLEPYKKAYPVYVSTVIISLLSNCDYTIVTRHLNLINTNLPEVF